VQHATVVPNANVTRLPKVPPDPWFFSGLKCEFAKQFSTRAEILSNNVASMTSYEQDFVFGGGVHHDYWMLYGRQLIQVLVSENVQAPMPRMAKFVAVYGSLVV
jgi:hypothetical protein